MALKSKIIAFIIVVGICLLAQSFDTYTGTHSSTEPPSIDLLTD